MQGHITDAHLLAADLTHHALKGHDILRQPVSPRFIPNATANNLLEVIDAGAFAQWLKQVHFFVAQQAKAQHTICGQSRARTASAKWNRHTANQADSALRTGNAIHPRFTIEFAIVQQFQRAKALLDAFTHFRVRDDLLLREVSDIAEGHHLDIAHVPGMIQRQRRQVRHIVFVEAAHRHRVEFDGR